MIVAYPTDRKLTATVLILGVCFTIWLCTRIGFLYLYQMPSRQTIHPNYMTFHEMSVGLEEGRQLGTINIRRLLLNNKHNVMANYDKARETNDLECNYLTLDPGYGIIVYAARHLMSFMTDSYLASVVLQLLCDGILLFLIFATFLRWGLWSSTIAGLLFAVNPTFAYNAIYPFAYFWEGALTAFAVIGLIWAQRFLAARRDLYGILCLIAAALCIGFGVWVRANLMAAGVFMAVFLFCAPATRRYASIFLLAFALMIVPQVMRASSVAGHFATSTRLVWHTALHGLGHYPNPYGIFDDDMYAFDIAHDNYGISYNFCDYRQHDQAIKDYYLKFAAAHPDFITRNIISRVINNIYFNFSADFPPLLNYGIIAAAVSGISFALLVGGEFLFAALLLLPLYIGLNIGIGLIYYVQPPYAYVTQWCLMMLAVLAVPAFTYMIRQIWTRRAAAPFTKWTKLRTFVFAMLALSFSGVLYAVPAVHNYVFMQEAWAPFWQPMEPLATQNFRDLLASYHAQSPALQTRFADYIHKFVQGTPDINQDIDLFGVQQLTAIHYFDRSSQRSQTIIGRTPLGVDLQMALRDISTSIVGWKIKQITNFDVAQPETWDGRQLKITLDETPERAQSDYQAMAIKKLYRYNWQAIWQDANTLTAVHLPKGCDELRQRIAFFYNGQCPKESYEELYKIKH